MLVIYLNSANFSGCDSNLLSFPPQISTEERLHRTMNKLRDTTGTMAGLGNLDNSYGSIGQRRPGKRSDDVMDKVAEAMAYRQRHAEEIKRRQEKKAQEAAEAKAKEATAAAAAATATETKTTGGSGTEEAKEENTEKKGWFSKWF